MVEASAPQVSARRLAARPVGAVRAVRSPRWSKRARIPRREVVLPVPGPPVRSITCCRAAVFTACDLFHTAALYVAEKMGYRYNEEEEQAMRRYLIMIKENRL